MSYRKLTKAERKNRDRILAWLNNEEFRENSRTKPAVPNLSLGEVLEWYVPPDITGAAQFFTPAEMSEALVGRMDTAIWRDSKVLDPCAGIGHLLWPLTGRNNGLSLIAYELEEECVKIGERLFPEVEWNWEIPFEHVEKLENQFDYVVMNPPIGTRRGMYPGDEMVAGMCTKSEHIFFVLAVRACKPGGQIGVLAPYNYLDRMPKALKKWRDENVVLDWDIGLMPGEFALTGVRLHGYIFRKLEQEDEEDPTYRKADPLIYPQVTEMPDDYIKCPQCGTYIQVDADGLAICPNCNLQVEGQPLVCDLGVLPRDKCPVCVPSTRKRAPVQVGDFQQLALF